MTAEALADDPTQDSVTTKPTRRKVVPRTAFTAESASRAGKASAAARSQRIRKEAVPPSDDEIERGLRQRAVSSAKDAEVLLRWLTRPRTDSSGLGLEERTEAELEALYRRLIAMADEDIEKRMVEPSEAEPLG